MLDDGPVVTRNAPTAIKGITFDVAILQKEEDCSQLEDFWHNAINKINRIKDVLFKDPNACYCVISMKNRLDRTVNLENELKRKYRFIKENFEKDFEEEKSHISSFKRNTYLQLLSPTGLFFIGFPLFFIVFPSLITHSVSNLLNANLSEYDPEVFLACLSGSLISVLAGIFSSFLPYVNLQKVRTLNLSTTIYKTIPPHSSRKTLIPIDRNYIENLLLWLKIMKDSQEESYLAGGGRKKNKIKYHY